MLSVEDLCVRFRGIVALDRVNLRVDAGEIVGLIGPNGAGKTTLFNCISRFHDPQGGEVRLDGTSLLALPRHAMARRGIARTFQNLALFESLSVAENVLVGGYTSGAAGFLGCGLRLPGARREEQLLRARAAECMADVGIGELAERRCSELPFPVRKRIEIARALMVKPRLLLLDEPAAGLNHEAAGALEVLIRQLRQQYGLAVLLVEHHMNLVMCVSDRVVAMEFGRVIADGTPAQVRVDPQVVRAYLGEPA